MTSNPILDAWIAAWSTGLNLTTQMSGQWLNQGGGMGQGHNPMTNPWAAWLPQAQPHNPWAALTGMMGMGNTALGNGPFGHNPWGNNPWAMAAGNSGNPFASLAPFASMAPFGSMSPFASMAGVQSLMAMAMAPFGGMAPSGGGTLPWPWNVAGGMPGNVFGGNAQGWPSGGAFGGAWGMPSGGFGALPRWPVMMGAASPASPSSPQLPWPWNMMGNMMGDMGAAASRAASSVPSHAPSRPTSSSPRVDDPMGFSQMVNFWSSLMPGAAGSRPEPEPAPEPAPEPKAAAPDLTMFFPWMKLLK